MADTPEVEDFNDIREFNEILESLANGVATMSREDPPVLPMFTKNGALSVYLLFQSYVLGKCISLADEDGTDPDDLTAMMENAISELDNYLWKYTGERLNDPEVIN